MALSGLIRPPQLQHSETDAGTQRTATWLELFFDLAFVLVVAELANGLRNDLTPHGAWCSPGCSPACGGHGRAHHDPNCCREVPDLEQATAAAGLPGWSCNLRSRSKVAMARWASRGQSGHSPSRNATGQDALSRRPRRREQHEPTWLVPAGHMRFDS